MKWLIFLCVVMLTNEVIGKSISAVDPAPQLRFIVQVEGKQFFVEAKTGETWSQAKRRCESSAMSLASITSEAQFLALKNAYDSVHFNGPFWVAGRDWGTSQQFKWDGRDIPINGTLLPLKFLPTIHKNCLYAYVYSRTVFDTYVINCESVYWDFGVLCELTQPQIKIKIKI